MPALIGPGEVYHWFRKGRGRGFSFFATVAELQKWLLGYLPANLGPWRLLVVDPVKIDRRYYRWEPHLYEVNDFPSILCTRPKEPVQLFLAPDALMAALQLDTSGGGLTIQPVCSANGVIVIHFDPHKPSSFGITDRVFNEVTGEVRKHEDMLRVLEMLRRRIRPSFVCTSIHRFPNGNEVDCPDVPMTAGAVSAYENGEPLSSRPGKPLK